AVAALTEPLGCVVHSAHVLTHTSARYPMQGGTDKTGKDGGGRGERVRCAVICGAGPAGLLWVQYLRNVLGYDGLLLVTEPDDGRPATYVRALDLIERGQVDVQSLITHRHPSLDSVVSAFMDDHRAPEYVKGVVVL